MERKQNETKFKQVIYGYSFSILFSVNSVSSVVNNGLL